MSAEEKNLTVQEHQINIDSLKQKVNQHCLCNKFVEDDTHYTVYYPYGYFPDGSRVSKGMGKTKVLFRLLEVMERHWKDNQL